MFRRGVTTFTKFDESFRAVFLVQIYLKAPVFVSDRCWLSYRLHPDSCCASVTGSGQYESVRLFFLEWLDHYLSAQAVENRAVLKALRRALLPYRHPVLDQLRLRQLLTRAGRLGRAAVRAISQKPSEGNLDTT